jgi:hypothetical protein
MKLVGIGQGSVSSIGYWPELQTWCHYLASAPANILSFSKCKDSFSISFDDDLDEFVLTPKIDQLKSSLPPLFFCADDQGLYHYSYEWTDSNRSNLLIAQQKSLVLNFTPEQVRIAKEARQLHQNLNHPGDSALGSLLENGGLMDCPITRRSLQLANDVLGPCSECLEAKMTDRSSVKNHNSEFKSQPPLAIGNHLHCDIVFITGPQKKKTLVYSSQGFIQQSFESK